MKVRFLISCHGEKFCKNKKESLLSFLFVQVIAAEGEQKSSKALKEASDIISESPAALQLR